MWNYSTIRTSSLLSLNNTAGRYLHYLVKGKLIFFTQRVIDIRHLRPFYLCVYTQRTSALKELNKPENNMLATKQGSALIALITQLILLQETYSLPTSAPFSTGPCTSSHRTEHVRASNPSRITSGSGSDTSCSPSLSFNSPHQISKGAFLAHLPSFCKSLPASTSVRSIKYIQPSHRHVIDLSGVVISSSSSSSIDSYNLASPVAYARSDALPTADGVDVLEAAIGVTATGRDAWPNEADCMVQMAQLTKHCASGGGFPINGGNDRNVKGGRAVVRHGKGFGSVVYSLSIGSTSQPETSSSRNGNNDTQHRDKDVSEGDVQTEWSSRMRSRPDGTPSLSSAYENAKAINPWQPQGIQSAVHAITESPSSDSSEALEQHALLRNTAKLTIKQPTGTASKPKAGAAEKHGTVKLNGQESPEVAQSISMFVTSSRFFARARHVSESVKFSLSVGLGIIGM